MKSRHSSNAPADRIVKRLAGGLLTLMPIAYVASIAVADIFGMVIAALFLLHSFHARDFSWLRPFWVRLAIALWVYTCLRTAFLPDPAEGLTRGVGWGRFLLLSCAVGYWLLPDPKLCRRVGMVWAAVVAFLVCDTFYQYFSGHDLLHRPVTPPLPGADVGRLTGPFKEPKIGIVLVWLSFPILGALCAWRTPRQPWLAGATWCAVAMAVFLAGERMAMLFMLLGGAMMVALLPGLRRIGLFALVLFALCTLIAAEFKPGLLARQYDSTRIAASHVGSSIYGQIWTSALTMTRAHPWFGVGPNHFRRFCPDAAYGDPSREAVAVRCNLHPHQLYLEWAAEEGLIGVGLFVAMAASALITAWRGRSGAVWSGLFVAALLRLWPLATGTSFFVAWAVLPFWLMLGGLLGISRNPLKGRRT